ncbi:hypothetical protein ABT301_10135 [Streptomyces sp. NPDC000987]|uniref:hypothetical protein n=1 Tax=Streptomyces sp. NPDC000987 TaxID=3154374 RepID=UPI00332E2592
MRHENPTITRAQQPSSSSVSSSRPGPSAPSPALVVGGTGMLAGVVRGLVADGRRTAVVARSEEALNAPADGAGPAGEVLPLSADYSDAGRFRAALRRARREAGLFRLAALWVHTPGRETALPVVAEVLAEDAVVVDVRGSAAADPTRERVPPPSVLDRAPRDYRPVVLGFTDGPAGPRRLTHQEISDGVLAVARAGTRPAREDFRHWTIGRVRPWHDRP